MGVGALVSRDVADFALALGVPARRVDWMSRHGERPPLPASGRGTARCPRGGERYRLDGNRLEMVDA